MSCSRLLRSLLLALSLSVAGTMPAVACDLSVESAWIRDVPGIMTVAAAYARLRNTGKQVLRVKSLDSPDFSAVTAHESRDQRGISTMRPIDIVLSPGATMEFRPSGRHFMLIDARRALKRGDHVGVSLTDESGCVTQAVFIVNTAP